MKIISENIKKMMTLMVAFAIIFTSVNVNNLTVEASENHSAGYDAIVAWITEHEGTKKPNSEETYWAADIFSYAYDDVVYNAMYTLTEAESLELDSTYLPNHTDNSSYRNFHKTWKEAWRAPNPDVPGLEEVYGWAWAAALPEYFQQKEAEEAAAAAAAAEEERINKLPYPEQQWERDPSTDPQTYGWSRESFPNDLFKHHNVGFTFVAKSGIKFRVTKEGGYHKLGHVEIIGYQPDKMPDKVDESNMTEAFLKNPPESMRNRGNMLETLACDYINDKHEVVIKKKRKVMKKIAARSGFEGKDEDLATYYQDMVVDTYVDGAFGRTSYGYHEFFLITSIAPGAFKNNKDLKYVYIPESVQTIPKDCFKGCKKLKTVIWGSNSLKYVNGHGLMKASGTPKYNAKKKICKGAFANCKNLKKFCLDGIYADIKVEKNAFDKDKEVITVGTYKCKNKYVKNFRKTIKKKGNAEKDANTKEYNDPDNFASF